ncbi:MAG: GNAT family N-acetyltransferase [Candidatus Ornithospirochaeta sp.]
MSGSAVVHHVHKAMTNFQNERQYLDIDEFGVREGYRRQGIARAMIEKIKKYARELGTTRIELNVWEFNKNAIAFYENVGFRTYRRYMEIEV